jgi:hypothetical protein
MDYKEFFAESTVEDKRRDLIGNPLFNREKIANATDDEILQLHELYFESMDKAMMETLGESMYDED